MKVAVYTMMVSGRGAKGEKGRPENADGNQPGFWIEKAALSPS